MATRSTAAGTKGRTARAPDRFEVAAGNKPVERIAGRGCTELVLGEWLHAERMDARYWWVNVGGTELEVRFGPRGGGRPKVTVRAAPTAAEMRALIAKIRRGRHPNPAAVRRTKKKRAP